MSTTSLIKVKAEAKIFFTLFMVYIVYVSLDFIPIFSSFTNIWLLERQIKNLNP